MLVDSEYSGIENQEKLPYKNLEVYNNIKIFKMFYLVIDNTENNYTAVVWHPPAE